MGVSRPMCTARRGAQAVAVLPQRDPAFIGKGDKLAACLLVQAGIGRVSDVPFHHRRIHGDTRQAAILHRP